ncbi:MAG: hypothetical protein R3F17_15015, partial [Planctomycetota bacterium]
SENIEKLKGQIVKLTSRLQTIEAEKETARLNEALAKSDDFLKKLDSINDQMEEAEALAKSGADPVRDLEYFVEKEAAEKEAEAKAAAEAAKKQKTIDFLNS